MRQKIKQENNWDVTRHYLLTVTINQGEPCHRQAAVCSQTAYSSFQTAADLWSRRSQLYAPLLFLLHPFLLPSSPTPLNPLWYPKQHLIVRGWAREGVIRWEQRQGESRGYTLANGGINNTSSAALPDKWEVGMGWGVGGDRKGRKRESCKDRGW